MFNLTGSETLMLNYTFFVTESITTGTSISGFWGYDTLQLGNSTFDNTVIGIRSDVVNGTYFTSNTTTDNYVGSTLGLGPKGQQNCVMWLRNESYGPTYESLLERVKTPFPNDTQASFSVWVDPKTKQRGLVIFGGMDEQFYDNSTYVNAELGFVAPNMDIEGSISQLSFTAWNGVGLNYSLPGLFTNSSTGITFANSCGDCDLQYENIILSSGNSFCMSQDALEQIASALNAEYSHSVGEYVLLCQSEAFLTVYIEVSQSLVINIAEFLIPLDLNDAAGNALCYLNIESLAAQGTIVLPNSVLNNYYIAVDYDQELISFAQPKEVPEGVLPSSIKPVTVPAEFATIDYYFDTYTTQYIGPTITFNNSVPTPTLNANMSSILSIT